MPYLCQHYMEWCTCHGQGCNYLPIKRSTEPQSAGTDHPASTPDCPLHEVLYRGADGKLCLSPRWYFFEVW
jgi:hypothetical protein